MTAAEDRWSEDEPLVGLHKIAWAELPGAFKPEAVPEILTGMASSDQRRWDESWDALDENQCLLHQGTVYEATVHAAPFLVRLVARERTLGRPSLALLLAHIASGRDEPYSPAGTADAVRDAIGAKLAELAGCADTADGELAIALVLVAMHYPDEFRAAAELTRRLREHATGAALDVLTAASCVLGTPSAADLVRLAARERESATTVVLRNGLMFYPSRGSTDYKDHELTSVVELPVHEQLTQWLSQGRPGRNAPATVRLARTIGELYLA